MKPVEAFGVVVRSIGLLIVLSGIWELLSAILNAVGGGPNITLGVVIAGAVSLLGGIALMVYADTIAALTYRGSRSSG